MSMSHTWYFELFLKSFRDGRNDKALEFLGYCRKEAISYYRMGGKPLLNIAIERGDADMVRGLLSHGADPNQQSDQDEAALHIVAKSGRVEFIQLLLYHHADLERQGRTTHFTPFITAFNECLLADAQMIEKKFETLRAFIRFGAKWDICVNNLTPLKMAHNAHHEKLQSYLDDSYALHADYFRGKLFKRKMPIHNILVSGVRKPAYRPLNFMIFAVRENFQEVLDFMLERDMPLRPQDFSFKLNDRFSTIEVLHMTGQADLLLNRRLWEGRPGIMEQFRKLYLKDAPASFWMKFNELEQNIYQNYIQKNIRPNSLKRRF